MESSAPSSWRREIGTWKNARPISSIQTGVLDPTSVTFRGVELSSARYSRAL